MHRKTHESTSMTTGSGDVTMIVEAELRNEIAKVVAKQASLAELYRWLMSRNWNVLRNSEHPAADLAVDVEDLLIEWSNQDRSEANAMQALCALLGNVAPLDDARIISVTSNVAVRVTMSIGSVVRPSAEIHQGATNRLDWVPAFAQL